MDEIFKYLEKYQKPVIKSVFRSRRDELVSEITAGINASRVGTKFKPITERAVAIRINKNPFLAHDDGEIAYLLKQCRERGNFSKFFWVTKTR